MFCCKAMSGQHYALCAPWFVCHDAVTRRHTTMPALHNCHPIMAPMAIHHHVMAGENTTESRP